MAYIEEIKSEISKLGNTFEEYKKTNDERLNQLNEKGSNDGLLDEKLARLDGVIQTVEDMKEHFEELEKKANRPGATDESVEVKHADAFYNWMRKGDESGFLDDPQVKAVSVGVDADGGYAAPEKLEKTLLEVERDSSNMRQDCRVIPVSGEGYKKLVNLGGAGTGWVGETDARPATGTPTLQPIAPTFGEIYANPQATQKSLDDLMFNVESWLSSEVGEEFGQEENAAYTNGDGVDKPPGLFAGTLSQLDDATRPFGQLQVINSGSAGAFGGDNLIDLIYATKSKYRKKGKFMMAGATVGYVRKLKDNDGNYLWAPGLQVGEPSKLINYAISENEDMAGVAADALGVAFGDFKRAYYIFDVKGVRLLRDPYTNKPYVGFYTTKRVGGMKADTLAVKVLQLAA